MVTGAMNRFIDGMIAKMSRDFSLKTTDASPVSDEFITDAQDFEGYRIAEYLGIISDTTSFESDVALSDEGSATKLDVGDAAALEGLEAKITEAKETTRRGVAAKAKELGANAIIGLGYSTFRSVGVVTVSATGTAVTVQEE